MAESSYPFAQADNGLADHETMMLTAAPDCIVEGLTVTVFSPLVVKLSPGRAMCGGWGYENTADKLLDVSPNAVGGTVRVDRLVLRKTFSETTGDVQVRAAIRQGANGPTPAIPALPKQRIGQAVGGVAIWETPVGRWQVAQAGGTGVQKLTNDGPGYGYVRFGSADVSLAQAEEGPQFDGGDISTIIGPNPVTTEVDNLRANGAGDYTVTLSVLSKSGAPSGGSYIRLQMGDQNIYEAIDLSIGRANVTVTGYLAEGALILPRIFQGAGSPTYDIEVAVTRHRSR